MARAKRQATGDTTRPAGGRRSRREMLLDNAARQLNARGLSLTSLAELAESLSVSRAALYYYVNDLHDLVFQCYRRSCEVLAGHLEEAIALDGDADAVVSSFIQRVLNPDQAEIAALAEIAVLPPEQQAIIHGLFHSTVARLAATIEAGVESRTFRSIDPLIAAHTIISILFWVPLAKRWSEALAEVERTELIKVITGLVLDGIAKDRKPPVDFQPLDLSGLKVQVNGVFDREEMSEAKRETLIAAASVLFNRKGVDATSLDEIAARVGATKRTLYHHVGDKQDLVGACYRRAFRMYLHIRDQTVSYEGTRLDALTASFHAIAMCTVQDDLCPLMPSVGFEALRAHEQREIGEYVRTNSMAYLSLYAKGQKEGSIRALDTNAIALVNPGSFAWLARDEPAIAGHRPDTIAREVTNLLRLGLRSLDT